MSNTEAVRFNKKTVNNLIRGRYIAIVDTSKIDPSKGTSQLNPSNDRNLQRIIDLAVEYGKTEILSELNRSIKNNFAGDLEYIALGQKYK
jgi:hypothetical protein